MFSDHLCYRVVQQHRAHCLLSGSESGTDGGSEGGEKGIL